ncbi:flagellar biosynthesis regulator FlaF [Roseomonas sp. OT10]|uniref:flagellar biosynthesis regulator FlaF n=1 Tax=Roseomonas cutis TaxID=2897332 RepID=UPI001E4041FA|nr:flagellar biosynthesis regulator FlaF [Roseomonas sp. OT10]UFN48297.1 flagellar biosynthesis regulator FlaF [Roseomonas sp. OT10]
MSVSRYARNQDASASPRDIELRAFRYVNGLLAAAPERGAARAVALNKAYRLWSILLADLLGPGNGLEPGLKGKLVSLGLWAQRECLARTEDAAGLEPLVALHRDMIEALESQPHHAAPAARPAAAFVPAVA